LGGKSLGKKDHPLSVLQEKMHVRGEGNRMLVDSQIRTFLGRKVLNMRRLSNNREISEKKGGGKAKRGKRCKPAWDIRFG